MTALEIAKKARDTMTKDIQEENCFEILSRFVFEEGKFGFLIKNIPNSNRE